MSFINFIEKNILILILLTAFILRVFQIFYGYPLFFVSDETPNILASLKMIGNYSFRAATPGYYYPAITSYVLLPFLSVFLFLGWFLGIFINVEQIKEIVLLKFGIFIPAARLASVLFGVLTVYLVYKICEELFKNKKIGFLAAWFLAISFMHVYNSHFAQTWVLQTFFIFLVMYLAVKFYNQENLRAKHYVLSGLAAGAAFGVNTVGGFSYFFILFVHFLKNKKNGFVKIFIKNKNFWVLNLILFLTMAFIYYLNPYGLQNHFNRITDTKTPAEFGGAGYSSYKPFSPVFFEVLWFYIKVIFSQETIFTILGIFGAFTIWFKNRTAFYFIFPWVIIYFIVISPLTGATGRYILPVVPALVILAAYFVHNIFKNFSSKIYITAIILISVPPLVSTVLFNFKLTKDDTHVLAYNWVINNIESGAKIKNEYLGESFPFIESRDAIIMIKELRPELFSTKRKYLLSLDENIYPKPNYFMSDYKELSEKIINFDYIILGSYKKQKLNDQKKILPQSAKLVKFFYPVGNPYLNINFPSYYFPPTDDLNYNPLYLFENTDYNGPYIEIYKIVPALILTNE